MQKGQAPILILVGIVVIIGVAAGAYFFGKSQVPKPQTQNQVISQTPQPTSISSSIPATRSAPTGVGETANWKTYTNTKYGFSVKYPLDKGFEINEELQNSIFIAAPQSDYGLVISIDKNPEVLNLMDWLRKQDFASIQINGKPLKFSDLTITNKTVAEYSGLEVRGPIPSYILISSQDKKYIFKISGYTLEEKLFNQILSTFRFDSLP